MNLPAPRIPRKSAVTIVLARGTDGKLLTLVGKRHPKSRFLPGYYAFPGGGHDAQDGDIARDGEDACLRRTAARELEEETGIAFAPGKLHPAGRRVTPPFAPRRFDSLMYVAALDEPLPAASGEVEELQDLHWAEPSVLYDRWKNLEIRIAPPLIPILETLANISANNAGVGFESIAKELVEVNDSMEADGPRIEFVPDILMIPVETPTLPPATHTNCYLVGSREFLVVDPGCCDPTETDRLLRHVKLREAGGRKAVAVVLTHHHGDHVGAAKRIADEFGIEIRAHRETWENWGGGSGRELVDGEVMALSGGERIEVLHTPGHAAGHVALLEHGQGSLIAGDLVSGVSTILVDSGPGELERYLASLERIRDLNAHTLFPGHGPPLISPSRAVQRVLDHRAEREGKILESLDGGPLSVDDVVRSAYADTPHAAHGLAVQQATSHLDRLAGLGRVCRQEGRWRLIGS